MAPEQSLQMEVHRVFETAATLTDVVNLRAADQGGDAARADLQIHHRSVAHIGAAARQPIGIIAVAFEVVAPRLAPERSSRWCGLQSSTGEMVWPFFLSFSISRAAWARRSATGT